METTTKSETTNREIISTRIINAPRELVFKVWTDPQHIGHWYGPNGFTLTIHKMDVREGGEWDFIMHGPDGVDYKNLNVYSKVIKNERLEYEHVSEPKHYVTVTFEKEGNKTKLTMHMVFDTAELYEYVAKTYKAVEGQKQTLNRMEEYIAEQNSAGEEHKEFVISREFNAPRELVYKVFSKAEHLAKWWGPAGLEMCDTKLDFRPGGYYHYGMKTPDGNIMWGKFVYREMKAPEMIVFVNSFSDKDGNITRAPFNPNWPLEVLNKLTLSEQNGKTLLTLRGGPVNASEAEHKAFNEMFSSMEQGFGGTFNQLADYLAKISK